MSKGNRNKRERRMIEQQCFAYTDVSKIVLDDSFKRKLDALSRAPQGPVFVDEDNYPRLRI